MENIPILDAQHPETPEQPEPVMPPVLLHLLNSKVFRAGQNEWQYDEMGVFAHGHFTTAAAKRLVLIPYNRIEYYEFEVSDA